MDVERSELDAGVLLEDHQVVDQRGDAVDLAHDQLGRELHVLSGGR